MKKQYKKPMTSLRIASFNSLCIGIVGSTEAGSGNLTKEEREMEEEFAAFIASSEEREGKNGLW